LPVVQAHDFFFGAARNAAQGIIEKSNASRQVRLLILFLPGWIFSVSKRFFSGSFSQTAFLISCIISILKLQPIPAFASKFDF
jgi:hypothetical protein